MIHAYARASTDGQSVDAQNHSAISPTLPIELLQQTACTKMHYAGKRRTIVQDQPAPTAHNHIASFDRLDKYGTVLVAGLVYESVH